MYTCIIISLSLSLSSCDYSIYYSIYSLSLSCLVLLQNRIKLTNLKGNVIKITDFGLAREIENTTHLSGAGTYPWMAPEVIKSSEFSKKSDVWRLVM